MWDSEKNEDMRFCFCSSPPLKVATEGGKGSVYKDIIKAADVIIGVCIVLLLEF